MGRWEKSGRKDAWKSLYVDERTLRCNQEKIQALKMLALERESSLEPKSPYSVHDCSPRLKSCKRNPVPSTELLSSSTQSQVPPQGTCNGRAQACGPGRPQVPSDIRTCPPCVPCLLWEHRAQGTASLRAGGLVLFSLAQVLPLCGAALG